MLFKFQKCSEILLPRYIWKLICGIVLDLTQKIFWGNGSAKLQPKKKPRGRKLGIYIFSMRYLPAKYKRWKRIKKNFMVLKNARDATATKIPLMYFFSGNSAASAPIYTFICLWAIYIVPAPRIGLHISSNRIGRPIMEINKSLTEAWMWKLGLSPRYSFSGNICFEISVFCLCSVCG